MIWFSYFLFLFGFEDQQIRNCWMSLGIFKIVKIVGVQPKCIGAPGIEACLDDTRALVRLVPGTFNEFRGGIGPRSRPTPATGRHDFAECDANFSRARFDAS